MTITVKVIFNPIYCECEDCVCSVRFSIREQGNPTWTTPTSPINPTQQGYYLVDIVTGVYYQARMTFIGPRCKEKSTYITLYSPAAQCCPDGFTLNPDGTYCYQIDDIDPTITGSPEVLVNINEHSYSTCGSYIYNMGWNPNGTGASTQISTANAFWVNGGGLCIDAGGFNGPLNRAGVWTSSPSSGQTIGFGVCLSVPETKTYFIGIASDNGGSITLDGVNLLTQDPTALATQYGVGIAAAFKVWHIYPVSINAGPHILELVGTNQAGAASIGCEVYNIEAGDFVSITSYADLGANLIFSSKDYIGQNVQIGTAGAGYTCPPDYTLAPCASPIKCRKITKVDVGIC